MFGVGISDQAECLTAKCKLGLTEECVVGGGDEPACHIENGVGRSALDAGREFLGLLFEFGAEWFRHDGLVPGGKSCLSF